MAATILPLPSEAVFSIVWCSGANTYAVLTAAILGNTLGAMTCYALGYLGKTDWLTKYCGMDESKVEKVKNWIQKRGIWLGFFSFTPGIGDFIVMALGLMRSPFWGVLAWVVLGKMVRYLVWLAITYETFSLFN
ncbi:MAG: VTT domain-containing protein [Paludibacteraceae bacterium]|nr:VTT domain-containing protein [Paludibacteraceae bacterium]